MQLTEKDLQILADIYRNRILTAKQIVRLYFNESSYGYRRINQLRDEGYLGSKPLVEGIRKTTQYYWATDKGIGILNLEKPRKSCKNVVSGNYLVKKQLAINEIYVTLMQLQQLEQKDVWKWEESREIKEIYNFNKGDRIAAVITSKTDGTKYGIYVPHAQSKMEELANNIKNEIEKHYGVRNNIIFCATREMFQYMKENMQGVGNSLMVLPHGPGINMVYNVLDNYDNWSRDVLHKYCNMPPGAVDEGLLFADYTDDNYYYVELLTLDIVKMKFLKKYAHDSKFPKPIKLLCWDTQEESIRKIFTPNSKHGENNKLKLTVLDFDNNVYFTGINERQSYLKDIRKPKSPDEQWVITAISVTTDIKKFLASLPPLEKSAYVRRLIESTDEYKKYKGGEQ